MFTRTVPQTETPDEEDMDLGAALCPPHAFESAWATPSDGASETVPCIYCASCGDVRALRIPADQ